MKENLPRRDFLQFVGLFTGSAVLSSCIPGQKETSSDIASSSTPKVPLTPTTSASETPEVIYVPSTLVEGNFKIFENEGRVLSAVGVDLGGGKRIDFAKVQVEGTQTPGKLWTEGFEELLSTWTPQERGDSLLISPTEKGGYKFEVSKNAGWAGSQFTYFELKDGMALNLELELKKGVVSVDFSNRNPGYAWKGVLSTQVYFGNDGTLTVAGFDGSKYPNEEWRSFLDIALSSKFKKGTQVQLQIIPKDTGTLVYVLDHEGKELGKVRFGRDMFPSEHVELGIGGGPGSVFSLNNLEISPRTFKIIRPMLAVWAGNNSVVTKALETSEGAWYSQQAIETNGELEIKSDSPEVEVLSPEGEIKYPVSGIPVLSSVVKKYFDEALVCESLHTVENIHPFERMSEGYLTELFPASQVFMSERGDVVIVNKESQMELAGQEVQTKYGNFCLLINHSCYQKLFEEYFEETTPYGGYPDLTTLYLKDELVRIYLTLVGLQQQEISLGSHLSTYTPRKKNFTFVRGWLGEAIMFSRILPEGLYDPEKSYLHQGGALSAIMKAGSTNFVQFHGSRSFSLPPSGFSKDIALGGTLGCSLLKNIMRSMIKIMLYHPLGFDSVKFHNKYQGYDLFLKSPFAPLFSHPEIKEIVEGKPQVVPNLGIREIVEVNFENFK